MKLFYGQIYPEIHIYEEEQQHILKVLRMRTGEIISITDGQGHLAEGELVVEGKKAVLHNAKIQNIAPSLLPHLHIAIAPTKSMDRLEFFIEKATELGVSEISFLQTEKSERKHLNIEKIKKQIISASKQSLRFHFPKIHGLVKLPEFLRTITPENTFVAHCNDSLEREMLSSITTTEALTFLIGPEGDFSSKEIQTLIKGGIRSVSLGTQRLRTETAGVFIAAWNYVKNGI